MKKATYNLFGKSSFFDREPSTMIQTSCNFSPYRCSNLEAFVDVWLSLEKSTSEFSMVYIKKSALMWLGAYNHDFGW